MSKKETKTSQEEKETKKAKAAEEAAEEQPEEAAAEEQAAPEEQEENPLEKELADTKEQLLRLTAEYSNFRKRSEKEKQETFNFAKAETLKELLPAIDNLERALANEQQDFEGLKKGVELTYNGFINTFNKLGVEAYGDKGDIFDPNLHNAVMHIEDDNFKDGEIVDVFQRGYKIGDKIIRPAMVKSAN